MAYDPYISAEQLAEIGVRKVEKEELFRISDIISLHLHANAETNGMICKETLALMKPTAILVNVSRGPLVKDEDLLDALRAIPSEETTLELQNGLSPIVFTPVDEKQDYAYMVLPVRLH